MLMVELREISKGYVQLQYIKDSCDLIQSVVIDIHQSLNSYKNYLSQNWYHKKFVELEDLEIHHLDSLLDNRLRLFGLDKETRFTTTSTTSIDA